MKTFTVLGAGWLGFELAKSLRNKYKIKVSSRSEEKINIYKKEDFLPYILNEENISNLEYLLDTDYLFINFPPSKFKNYISFLNKIYNHKKIKSIEKVIFISSTSIYPKKEAYFTEEFKIVDSSNKVVYDAEKFLEDKTDVIFRVSALIGSNRIPGRRLSNKNLEFPKTKINFVHRKDVIAATRYVIDNNLKGIFNLCANSHPSKEDLYRSNAKKYSFETPIFSKNKEFLNRIIDGSKISRLGFKYRFENAFDMD